MANHKSAEKRIRQAKARRLANRYVSRTARNSVRKLREMTNKEDAKKNVSGSLFNVRQIGKEKSYTSQ